MNVKSAKVPVKQVGCVILLFRSLDRTRLEVFCCSREVLLVEKASVAVPFIF